MDHKHLDIDSHIQAGTAVEGKVVVENTIAIGILVGMVGSMVDTSEEALSFAVHDDHDGACCHAGRHGYSYLVCVYTY